MNSIDQLAQFFGWCTVINMGIYLITVIAIALFRNTMLRANSRIFAVSQEDVARLTMLYIGLYKLTIIALFFVPYVALKIMS